MNFLQRIFYQVMVHLVYWKRAVLLFLAFWLGVTYLVISPLRCACNEEALAEYEDILKEISLKFEALKLRHSRLRDQSVKPPECPSNQDALTDLQNKLKHITSQFKSLKQRYTILIKKVKKTSGLNEIMITEGVKRPSRKYEILRRRVYTNTKELWYYISKQLEKLKTVKAIKDDPKLQIIIDEVAERKRSLLSDQQALPQLDGYSEWRRKEAANVSDLVQRRLRYLQNPPDCKDARKIVCNLNKKCGFGCHLHHLAYCLIAAYETERTLILDSNSWSYDSRGWDYVFEPISENCTSTYNEVSWPVAYSDAKVIALPLVFLIAEQPKFLPQAIPSDLANRITRFNGDPASWWIGQMLKYFMRPRKETQGELNESIANINIKKPFVGVHIRRTDKVGTESAFHTIHDYMKHVKDYYDQLELTTKLDARRVYLATDDAKVLLDARKKYPAYKIYGNASIAKNAGTNTRYTPTALSELLLDLHMLAISDFVVCTFSSQLCRLTYELMQHNRVDASESFVSLDDIYYFGGQIPHDRIAVLNHSSTNKKEITMMVNDKIGIDGNHWDGYGQGINRRTKQKGLLPWYKTEEYLVLYPFPEYKEVPLY